MLLVIFQEAQTKIGGFYMLSYEENTQVSMLKLLEKLVNIDSGSTCKEGIDRFNWQYLI